MSDPSRKELLEQLKLERTAPPPRQRRGGMWAAAAAVLVLAGGAAVAVIGFRADAAVEVRTARAVRSVPSTATVLDASGYLIARRQATVSSKITGKVVEVLIEEGMAVEQDQVMARLDDRLQRARLELAQAQLASAEGALAEVEVQLGEARRSHARNRRLARQKLVSDAVLDASRTEVAALEARLERARREVTVAQRNVALERQALEDTVVRAPFAGVVTVKAAQAGEMISPVSAGGGFTRTGIGTIVDMDSLEIEVDVNENFIDRVRPGQPVEARLNAYPDWAIPGHVLAIVPTADRQKATVRVRIAIDGPRDPRMLPDMGVRVSFRADEAPAAEPVVTVPRAAVLSGSDGTVVFVIAQGRTRRVPVRTGRTLGDRVVVTQGLSGGELLATSNLELLSDGAAVRMAQ